MKYPTICLIALLAIPVLFAIHKLDSPFDTNSKIKFDFERTLQPKSIDRKRFQAFFDGFSKNVNEGANKTSLVHRFGDFNKIDFIINRTSTVDQFGKLVSVENGSFTLICKDGQSLFGKFEGYADHTNDQGDVLIYLSVDGGTGRFHEARGYMKLKYDSSKSDLGIDTMKMKGKISIHKSREALALAKL